MTKRRTKSRKAIKRKVVNKEFTKEVKETRPNAGRKDNWD